MSLTLIWKNDQQWTLATFIRAITLVVAKMYKIQKVLNFTHFNLKHTHISTCKNVQIYTTALQMNNNHAYMHGYCSCANDFFIPFFSLLYQITSLPLRLQQPAASPTSTTTQHGRIRRKMKKITTQPPNLAPPPNTAT